MDKNDKPIISIITPVYNDAKTVERMVASIADQDYKYKEHILVDDGSTDNSKEVLKKLEKKYPIKVIYLPENKGACYARNEGAKYAKGKYLSFLPADAKLYPGMARIWVEALEENPDYDFIYGGYKFTDEQYHEMFSYMSDSFDPYFLKVTNYIDGSFPLKKELFDKMGGWDETIKSLQDWDFWLNAVINHNAKGIYRREVFFETTFPHAGGLSDDSSKNWIARTEYIKKKYGIEPKKICVTSQGAEFHGKNVAKYLGADYLPMPSFKPHKYEMIYVIGFFGNVAQCFHNTNAMRVVHWIGSDILQLQQAKPEVLEGVVRWLDNNVDVNLCEIEATRLELEKLGIKARVVPFPPEIIYRPVEMPKEKAIAVYMPYQNKVFYQPDLVYDVAKELPDVKFYLFGDVTTIGEKNNVIHVGNIRDLEKDNLIKNTGAILRLTPHDGLPLSVVEWVTAGRQAILTIDIPHTHKVKLDKKDIIKTIKKLKWEVNTEGSEYYRTICNPEVFKKSLYSLLEFDIKKWWDKISPIWHEMESAQESTEDIGRIIKEVKELKPKTLIDLGCGTGRFADLLPVDDYTGLDFSEQLIKEAEEKHPDKKFIVADILNYVPKEKFDVAFTFASLLHVPPKKLDDYVKALKKIAKKAVFVEPIKEASVTGQDRYVNPKIIQMQKEDPEFIFNVKYTWIHDYLNKFNCEKVIPMSNNRNMFVIDLTK